MNCHCIAIGACPDAHAHAHAHARTSSCPETWLPEIHIDLDHHLGCCPVLGVKHESCPCDRVIDMNHLQAFRARGSPRPDCTDRLLAARPPLAIPIDLRGRCPADTIPVA